MCWNSRKRRCSSANFRKIEIGGTKGKVLTTSVQRMHQDFTQAVNRVRSYGDDRLLDTEGQEFDDAHCDEFRTSVLREKIGVRPVAMVFRCANVAGAVQIT